MTFVPPRGHIYRMNDPEYGTLFCLVVSAVYARLEETCVAVRVSVTNETRDFPGWVRLQSGDPAFGYVVTHDIDQVEHSELKEDLGALSMETMNAVEQALRRVLGL